MQIIRERVIWENGGELEATRAALVWRLRANKDGGEGVCEHDIRCSLERANSVYFSKCYQSTIVQPRRLQYAISSIMMWGRMWGLN